MAGGHGVRWRQKALKIILRGHHAVLHCECVLAATHVSMSE